jgi:uncharacterized membrane protein (Fun14 family)
LSSEALLSNIIPFAGSGLVGYAMGFALKKILKWMLIIVGFLVGPYVWSVTVESTIPVAVPSRVIVPTEEFWGVIGG